MKYRVSPRKEAELERRMQRLEIYESDIEESFIKGSGRGGQKINKTNSCVRLFHAPTCIEVKCQQDRSQSLNRYLARRLLCDHVENILEAKNSAQRQRQLKIRRQKKRRSRRLKEQILQDKRIVSDKKRLRQLPPIPDKNE